MLGKTAGGLFWMYRYLERAENSARLLEAGFRIALTRPSSSNDEWASIIATGSAKNRYEELHDSYQAASVIDFVLRERTNPSSVISCIEAARSNARLVRTALTREVWEAINEWWMSVTALLKRPVRERDLPDTMGGIRQSAALVRAALHGTMLRNDIFNFCRLGTFLERADNTARILDVKYYVLLPSVSKVGSTLDNVQWEMILRSVSAHRSFRWLKRNDINPRDIAEFLVLDMHMPRSLIFCYSKICSNLGYLREEYNASHPCHEIAETILARLKSETIDSIFDHGLHEFIQDFIRDNGRLGAQLEKDYRFTG